MIYLSAEVISGLGEDTFWTWFHREFPSQFGVPDTIEKDDIVLQYSTLGMPKHPDNTVALLWELHPEMKAKLNSNAWDSVLERISTCAKYSKYRTTASELMLPYYAIFGKITTLPIGVDTDLFRPMDKLEMRQRYKMPLDKTIGFWCGTSHPMKGFDRLQSYARNHPEIVWIIVWKQFDIKMPNAYNFTKVSQPQLAELMNCADFFLSCGRLSPFFMVEWEAMATGLQMRTMEEKDFVPSIDPRKDIFTRCWSRKQAKVQWQTYLENL